MATNYIEEFFIGIGFDTKRVKKEAKEIDKLLDGLVSKKRKQVSAETKASKEKAKVEARIHKTTKASDADNAKHFIKQEKAKQVALAKTNAARIKQAVGNITAPTGATRKGGIGSAFTPIKAVKKVELDTQSLIDKAIEKRHNKEIKREADLHRVKITDQKALDSLAADNRKIAERQQKELAAWAKKGQNIKDTKVFRSLPIERQLSLGAKIDEAVSKKHARSLKELSMAVRDTGREFSKTTRKMREQGVVQKGLTDSTRNMIRSYASVFALFQGTVAIKKVGQDFESLRASMLVVSSDEADVTKKLGFIRKEAYRLGIDFRAAAKAFMQLSASAGDALGEKGIKRLFTSVMSISKAFGMSLDDTKGTFRAFVQMLSKGNVQAEELRGQLGERLYGAFNLAAKAMGKTTQELNKSLEQGQVLASDLLPKLIPLMDELANKNGALAKQLLTAQTAQNRFNTDLQEGADIIWKSGMSEGMKDLFTTMSTELQESQGAMQSLGKALGVFFKALARLIEMVTPVLELLANNMEIVFGGGALMSVRAMTAATATFGTAAAAAWTKVLAPLTAVVAALTFYDDFMADWDDNKLSTTEKAAGYQTIGGQRIGIEKGKDGKYYSTGKAVATQYDIMLPPTFMQAYDSLFGASKSAAASSGVGKTQAKPPVKIEVNISANGNTDPQEIAKVTRDEVYNAFVGVSV